MAEIALRDYNQEIETMLGEGRYEEAIVHCLHILKAFPKHVDTYRQLGNAFLETKRFTDALDIFQRVLSSIPDDFIANLGMSIIREDEGNLDEAIWYMERAFEQKPANKTIQEELRRLYGRRDKIEPEKIRLTRGALARMYAKGDQVSQAIAEVLGALTEDPNRADLQVLLAKLYYQSGNSAEAEKTCRALLNKLPNCLEANRILAAILKESGQVEEAEVHLKRAQLLDPYVAKISPEALGTDMVPTEAITIAKLEAPLGQIPQADVHPTWASDLGITASELLSGKEAAPDWMANIEAAEIAMSEQAEAESRATPPPEKIQEESIGSKTEQLAEETIPVWLKEAGWEPSSGAAQGESLTFESEEEISPAETEAQAPEPVELPDWLQSIAPPESAEEGLTIEVEQDKELAAMLDAASSSEQKPQPAEEVELPTWLDEVQPGPTDTIGHWLAEKTPDEVAAEEEVLPDWLIEYTEEDVEKKLSAIEEILQPIPPSLEAEATEMPPEQAEEEELPDWLLSMTEEESEIKTPEAFPPEAEAFEVESPPTLETSDVLPAAVEEIADEELPDWLINMAEEVGEEELSAMPETAEPAAATPEEATDEEALPDWLFEATEESETSPTEAVSSEPEIEWQPNSEIMESTPIAAGEATSTPLESMEAEAALPEWFEELEKATAATEAPTGPVAPAEFDSYLEETPGFTEVEEGAVEEEIPYYGVTEAEAEAAIAEWIEEVEAPAEAYQSIEEIEVEIPEQPTSQGEAPAVTESLPEWLQEFDQEVEMEGEVAPFTDLATPKAQPETEIPDWLRLEEEIEAIAGEAESAEVPASEVPFTEAKSSKAIELESPPDFADMDTAIAWLEELANKYGPEAIESVTVVEKPGEKALTIDVSEKHEADETIPPQIQTMLIANMAEETRETEGWRPEREFTTFRQAAAGEELREATTLPVVERLNINRASLVELERLPGVGYRLAQSILNYRQTQGPFTCLEELKTALDVDEQTFELLSTLLTVEEVSAPTPTVSRAPFSASAEVKGHRQTLERAQYAIEQGQPEAAVEAYNQLIRSQVLLDEVIFALQKALKRYPDEFSLWQALGDACVRADRLEEALDAYQHAEAMLK